MIRNKIKKDVFKDSLGLKLCFFEYKNSITLQKNEMCIVWERKLTHFVFKL